MLESFMNPLSLMAAAFLRLNGRTRNGAIRTEHATVAGLGAQQSLAAGAFVEILAGISGHRFLALQAAIWTGDDRPQYEFAHKITRAGSKKRLLDYNGGPFGACHL
jgi:hypothetical protein